MERLGLGSSGGGTKGSVEMGMMGTAGTGGSTWATTAAGAVLLFLSELPPMLRFRRKDDLLLFDSTLFFASVVNFSASAGGVEEAGSGAGVPSSMASKVTA